MTIRPPEHHPLTATGRAGIPPAAARPPYETASRPTTSVVTVTAHDLHLLPSCVAIDLTDVTYALPVPRGQGSGDHHWQWVAPRREDGWTVLHEIDAGQSPSDPASQKLRQTLGLEYVMLGVEDPVPHATGRRNERVIAVHSYEVLRAQIRTEAPCELLPGGCASTTDPSVEAALARAASRQAAVVLALTDGTRLNGVPALALAGSGIVQLREEAGQEPFTVSLAHVMYVRALTVPEG